MTSHNNSHRTTDIKPEMLSGVQTGNGTPHDKYDIRGIAHARTNRKVQSFTYILMWGRGNCTLTKRTRRWTYSALRHYLRGGQMGSAEKEGGCQIDTTPFDVYDTQHQPKATLN